MRADEGALVALDAVLLDPFRHRDAHAALFKSRRACVKPAVLVPQKRRHRQAIAARCVHRFYDLFYKIVALVFVVRARRVIF